MEILSHSTANGLLLTRTATSSNSRKDFKKHARSAAIARTRQQLVSVVTYQQFYAPLEAVWQVLIFYEEIANYAPFFLRYFLPVPIGTEGCKSEVGSEVRCRYVGGHLVKRVTQISHGHTYAFEIIEQNLALSGIRLLGGDYTLRKLSQNQTRVALTTRYSSPNRPRWFCKWLEAAICHSFHRYILAAMQRNL